MSQATLVQFVWIVIVVVGSMFGLVLLVTLGHKLLVQIRTGYERRQRAVFLPKIHAYIHADTGHFGQYIPGPLGVWDRRVILWTLLDQIRYVRGRVQHRITAAFEELGFVDAERRKLADRRWVNRVEGAEKLGRMMSRRPLPELVQLMRDPVPEVRIRAAKALGAIGGLEAVESLLGALKDTNRWSALRIADILATLGEAAVDPLLREVPKLPAMARVPAIDILGRLRSPKAVRLLEDLLNDSHDNARARAAHSLGVIGDPRAAPKLVLALKDSEWPVRAMAAKALGMLPGTTGVPELKTALGDREWWVRSNAALALGSKGEKGYQALAGLLDSPDAYAAQRAASMLQEAGVFDRFVGKLVDGTPRERAAARKLLGKLVMLQRTDLLQDIASRHDDPAVREAVTGLLTAQAEPVAAAG
ncbi:MAG TPA: HEAT repeat domain-containing protein [Gemmatimonadales bacterium]|nr:HEAT repeat domain-containing protein [Gemmatimonadales bacterium]